MIWRAQRIWATGCRDSRNCYVYARRQFDLDNVSDASLYIACSSEYKTYINGRYVGRGTAQCGRSYHPFDRYEIKSFLRPGPNVIGVICHNRGVDSTCGPGKPGGLLAQINIAQSDEPILSSDSDWRVSVAREWDSSTNRISAETGFREVYNSRLKPVGWNVVGFDDSNWQVPEILGEADDGAWGELVSRAIPHLAENEIAPVSIVSVGRIESSSDATDPARRMCSEPIQPDPSAIKYPRSLLNTAGDYATICPCGDIAIVLDFGRIVVGFPEIGVLDGGAAAVDIGYSDNLNGDGVVCGLNGATAQADRVFLHGGRQEWQVFGRRALRYIQLTFRDVRSPILLRNVSITNISYPVKLRWSFECSDGAMNAAWKESVEALGSCMQDTYEPDPLRNPAYDPSVSRSLAMANYYTFYDAELAASDIRRFARDLSERDEVSALPQKQLVDWVLMLHEHYLHIGDRFLIEDVYSTLQNVVDKLECEALREASKLALAVDAFDDARAWHERVIHVGKSSSAVLEPDENRADLSARATMAAHFIPEILGIKPSLPQSREMIIQPHPGALEWARGGYDLPTSSLQVEWQSNDTEFSIEIEGSDRFVVAIPVGRFKNPVIHEIDLTPETPERRARKTYGWGDVIWRAGGERDPYIDWLYTQETDPPDHYTPMSRCDLNGEYVWVREMICNHVRYVVHEDTAVGC